MDYGTNLYVCRPCDARVGTHRRSKKPLRTLANAELREMRTRCHAVFDRLWKSKEMTRGQAYKWIQKVMNLSSDDAHIGMFDMKQCQELLHHLKIKRIHDLKNRR